MLEPGRYPAEEFDQAWRDVILYDEHTWGAHNSISEPEGEFALSQWKIKQAFALDAEKQSQELLDKSLAKHQSHPKRVEFIDVINTCSWPRTDLVVFPKQWVLAGIVVFKGIDRALIALIQEGGVKLVLGDIDPYADYGTLHVLQ